MLGCLVCNVFSVLCMFLVIEILFVLCEWNIWKFMIGLLLNSVIWCGLVVVLCMLVIFDRWMCWLLDNGMFICVSLCVFFMVLSVCIVCFCLLMLLCLFGVFCCMLCICVLIFVVEMFNVCRCMGLSCMCILWFILFWCVILVMLCIDSSCLLIVLLMN